MKPSRYNRWITHPGSSRLLFNSRSAALVEIEPESVDIISRLLATPESAANDTEREYVENLVYGKFLVPDEIDELAHLKAHNREQRFISPTFFLTIAPTLACNFACAYCYESTGGKPMDTKTELQLLSFADRRLPHSPNMLVTWFGGEPTLCLDTVLRIQQGLTDMAAAHNVKMEPAAIITNGYKLTGQVSEQLVQVGITSAQVTIDGPRQLHDQRRPLRTGGGTFARIMQNLAEAAGIIRITIRVNVDPDSIDIAHQVMSDLNDRGLLSKVSVYFAPVDPSEGVCADIVGRCFSSAQFARAQVRLYEKLLESGFACIDYPSLAPGGHCGADSANAWVVGPNGLLFKCWEELSLSPDNSVGSLACDELTPGQQANLDRYYAWDPFEKSACTACEVLPICMGGCPIQGMRIHSPKTGACSSWKYNLGDMLKLRYLLENRKEVNP